MIDYELFITLDPNEQCKVCWDFLRTSMMIDHLEGDDIKLPATKECLQTIIDYVWEHRYDVGYEEGIKDGKYGMMIESDKSFYG